MGIVYLVQEVARVQNRKNGSNHIVPYNMPILLKKEWGHPIRARLLEWVHLEQSSLYFLWCARLEKLLVHVRGD